MKIIFYLFPILLVPSALYGQSHLIFEGKVTDMETKNSLQDCHVYIGCRHTGTVTDASGRYHIEVPGCCMTQCLIVTHQGYDKYMIPVHNIVSRNFNIELNAGAHVLAELIFTPDRYYIQYKQEFEPFQSEKPNIYLKKDPKTIVIEGREKMEMISMQSTINSFWPPSTCSLLR